MERLHEQRGVFREGFLPRVARHLRQPRKHSEVSKRLDHRGSQAPGALGGVRLASGFARGRLRGEQQVAHERHEQLHEFAILLSRAKFTVLVPFERTRQPREEHGEDVAARRAEADHRLQRGSRLAFLIDHVRGVRVGRKGEEHQELDRVQRERLVVQTVVRQEQRKRILLQHVPRVQRARHGPIFRRVAAQEPKQILQRLCGCQGGGKSAGG